MADDTAQTEDWQTFLDNISAMETSVGMTLPLEVANYLERARELAYRAGWKAGHRHATAAGTLAVPREQTPQARSLKTLEEGESGWVLPQAIIEHGNTRRYFADPYFDVADQPTDDRPIRVTRTTKGFVAHGPTNLHRISPERPGGRLIPLVEFSEIAPN